MKSFTASMLTLVTLLAVAVPVFADDRKDQLAIEYLELSKTKESFDITIETYVDQLSSQNPSANKKKLREFFEAYMGWGVLKKPTIKIVADSFTEEELLEINNFYKSKTGKALAEKTPALSAAISKLIGENLNKAMGTIGTIQK
jgi:hypothetical protein